MMPCAFLQYALVIVRKRSCPAVSHICSFTSLSLTVTVLNRKSTPIVARQLSLNSSSANRLRMDDFPTEELPTITILNWYSASGIIFQQMDKKKIRRGNDDDDEMAHINMLLSPNKITTYPKAQTIEQMIARLPESRIIKESSKRNISKMNHEITDSLNRFKLLQEQKSSLFKQLAAMDISDCGALRPYPVEALATLHQESLQSKLPLINALRHIQNTKITPEELLDSFFVRQEQQEQQNQPLIISKDRDHQLSYNFLGQVKNRLMLMKVKFKDDCNCVFASKPQPDDLELRADIFAKLYLNYEKIEIEEEKMIKDDTDDADKLKEEKVEDQDLGAQVNKLLDIINKKTNQKSFQLFKLKQYSQSTETKAKFQKLLREIEELDTNMARLKRIHIYKSQQAF